MTRTEAAFAVAKDAGLLALGLGGIAYQQITGHVYIPLLFVYMTCLGIPGARALWRIFPTGTTEPSSPSPSSASPSLPPSRSPD